MLIEEMILNEIRELRALIENFDSSEKKSLKIPEASKHLGIGQAKLRELCKNKTIPAMKLGGSKKPQYIIYIPEARNILTRGGYLLKTEKKSGRKSTLDLSQ